MKRTLDAILHLQRAIAKRFGKKVYTFSGAAQVSIAYDRVELTNEGSIIVARGPAQVVRVLRRRRRAK